MVPILGGCGCVGEEEDSGVGFVGGRIEMVFVVVLGEGEDGGCGCIGGRRRGYWWLC